MLYSVNCQMFSMNVQQNMTKFDAYSSKCTPPNTIGDSHTNLYLFKPNLAWPMESKKRTGSQKVKIPFLKGCSFFRWFVNSAKWVTGPFLQTSKDWPSVCSLYFVFSVLLLAYKETNFCLWGDSNWESLAPPLSMYMPHLMHKIIDL